MEKNIARGQLARRSGNLQKVLFLRGEILAKYVSTVIAIPPKVGRLRVHVRAVATTMTRLRPDRGAALFRSVRLHHQREREM